MGISQCGQRCGWDRQQQERRLERQVVLKDYRQQGFKSQQGGCGSGRGRRREGETEAGRDTRRTREEWEGRKICKGEERRMEGRWRQEERTVGVEEGKRRGRKGKGA